jgi:hypothetical protein
MLLTPPNTKAGDEESERENVPEYSDPVNLLNTDP